jgi:hypothetical protein
VLRIYLSFLSLVSNVGLTSDFGRIFLQIRGLQIVHEFQGVQVLTEICSQCAGMTTQPVLPPFYQLSMYHRSNMSISDYLCIILPMHIHTNTRYWQCKFYVTACLYQWTLHQLVTLISTRKMSMHGNTVSTNIDTIQGEKLASQYYVVCMSIACTRDCFALPARLSYCLTREYDIVTFMNVTSYTHNIHECY